MKKIIVIGCPGSGKSTFSRELHNKTSIPLYHLDMMYWNADKTKVAPASNTTERRAPVAPITAPTDEKPSSPISSSPHSETLPATAS